MTIKDAKARVGTIWNLAHVMKWPIDEGETLSFAFWRGNERTPALSITPDGRGWHDFATGRKGDMVTLLGEVLKLSNRDACKRFVAIAEGAPEVSPQIEYARGLTAEEKRAGWPKYFGVLELDEIFTIASRRKFPHFEGVNAAARRGLLVKTCRDAPGAFAPVSAWGIIDSSRNAMQVRRLDGKPWPMPGGAGVKSRSMPGSMAGWPIGIAEVGERSEIVLTEGEPDLLAALTLQCLLNPGRYGTPADPGTTGFCCVTGGAKAIAESALSLFSGKTVVIVPHVDATGGVAEETWGRQLVDAGAKVKVFNLAGLLNDAGAPAKDLNDVVTNRGFPAYRDQLSTLFTNERD